MQIIWAAAAVADLHAARDHVAVDNAAAAEALVDRIAAAVDRLRAFPALGRSLPAGLRVVAVSSTRFRLVYRADEAAGMIQILAVWHGARQWPYEPN